MRDDIRDTLSAHLAAMFPQSEGVQYGFWTPDGEGGEVRAGLAERATARPVTQRTAFHSFSMTKPVTALAVLQLVARGRAALDDPISDYLPDIPYTNGATLREVLTHQAGLPNPMPLSWVHADSAHAGFDAAAFYADTLRAHPRCGKSGEQVRYSNIGFLLLGQAVESLSGLPYPRYVEANILAPALASVEAHPTATPSDLTPPMTEATPGARTDSSDSSDSSDSAYLGFDISQDDHATGYTRRLSMMGLMLTALPDKQRLRHAERGWIRYSPFHLNGAAYGGLMGNAQGWLRLLRALATRSESLLPREHYEAFFTPQPLSVTGRSSGHALAWFVGYLGARPYVCHAGGGPGYYAEARIYPSLGAASVLLTNTTRVRDQRYLDQLDRHWLK
jgi:D-alanyl-D-alanine carboxypeptidase